MVISQVEAFWAELQVPSGSALGYRWRVVLVDQGDAFNRGAIRTVVCVAVSGDLRLVD